MSLEDLSREELFSRIRELESQLKKNQKYGLVWESKEETVISDCKNKFPILKRVDDKSIREGDGPINYLIEGDNYHALKVLEYTHKGKVDVIYIDPPYNTGNKDFIYNDSFVDKDDGYRHSKWLSFMENRLKLAKELLKDTGVIFISIDDNEQAQLKLLCDSVFGERNFVANLTWVKKEKASGVPPKSMIIPNFEYILVYQNKNDFIFRGQKRSMASYKLDNDGRYWRYMPIQATGNQNNYFDIIDPKTNKKYYGNWAFSKKKIEDLINNNKIRFPKKDDGKPVQIVYADEMPSDGSAVFTSLGKFDSEVATKDFNLIFGEKIFDFPKPIDLIKFIVSNSKESDIILDFFAGSGTTGHAVLELNKQDGGNRQFILVTNNGDEKSEHKIAEKITYERLKRVMNGYTNKKGEKVEGLGGNLDYFKCDFIEKTDHQDNMRLRIAENCLDTVLFKENNDKIEKQEIVDNEKVYTIANGLVSNLTQSTAVYHSWNDEYLNKFKKDIEKIEGSVNIYLNPFIDKDEFSYSNKFIIKNIPDIN